MNSPAPTATGPQASSNVVWQESRVDRASRVASMRQRPCVLWFTGLSGAGKTAISTLVERRLVDRGGHTYLLDGDNLRHGLCRDLGFSVADRVENIRRVGEVGRLMADAGLIVLSAFISPFCSDRELVRGLMPAGEFIEVFVDTPLAECERRDPKGLYKKARAGEIRNFTGLDSPYEAPRQPEVRLDTIAFSAEQCADQVCAYLERAGLLPLG
jgi:adenylylsulfate kinase